MPASGLRSSLHPPLETSTCRAVRARISGTSRQVSRGLACSISAATPDTIGAEAEVPPKSSVYLSFTEVVVISGAVAGVVLRPDGAQTVRFAPRSL